MKCHIHISATYKVLNMLDIIREKKKKKVNLWIRVIYERNLWVDKVIIHFIVF